MLGLSSCGTGAEGLAQADDCAALTPERGHSRSSSLMPEEAIDTLLCRSPLGYFDTGPLTGAGSSCFIL